jgi:peptide/nickel transport system substrate-binding protein
MKSPIGPNYTHFNNSQYDEIFEQSAMIISDSLRYGKYMELDQLMMEESPVIILYYDQAVRFINRRIQGLSNHPMNYLDLKRLNIIEQ